MKIYIVGVVGSGKTTLAKRWSNELGIPFHELDCIIYSGNDKDRHKRSPEKQRQLIDEIDQNEHWIIEGTYRESCHCLLDYADKIVFLDTPLWRRLVRIFSMHMRQVLHIEPCHYIPTFKMLKYMYRLTMDFEKNKTAYLSKLTPYKDKLMIIRSNENVSLKD